MTKSPNEYAKIVAKAWSDEEYRKRLIDDPNKVLSEEGWDVDSSTTVQIKPDSDRHTLILGLPKRPDGLADEHLSDAANAAAGRPCANPCGCC